MSDDVRHWFTAREGSTLFWFPKECPLGMIETNPEHEPIMHWLGGGDEVLKLSPSGAYIIDVPNPHMTISIGLGKAADEPFTGNIVYAEIGPDATVDKPSPEAQELIDIMIEGWKAR